MTVTYYSSLLKKLREKNVEKRRGRISKIVRSLQDSAPAHKSLITLQKIDKIDFELVENPNSVT